MRLLFTSYHHEPSFQDPQAWLRRISAYIGIPAALAEKHEVMMLEHINYEGNILHEGITVHFMPLVSVRRKNQLMRGLQPDVIFINGLRQGLRLLRLRAMLPSAKIVLIHRAEQPASGLRRLWHGPALKLADHILFGDDIQAAQWAAAYKLKAGRLVQIPQGSSVFHADPSLWPVSPVLRLLFVGRLNENKDPLCLLRAVSFLRDAGVNVQLKMVYQTAEMLDEVLAFIHAHGLRHLVDLVDALPHDQLGGYYHEADVLVCCSHYESFGAVVVEALSCGCLPVCSNIPAFRSLAADGAYGELFNPGDAAALFRVLVDVSPLLTAQCRLERVRYFEAQLSFKAIAKRLEERCLGQPC